MLVSTLIMFITPSYVCTKHTNRVLLITQLTTDNAFTSLYGAHINLNIDIFLKLNVNFSYFVADQRHYQ